MSASLPRPHARSGNPFLPTALAGLFLTVGVPLANAQVTPGGTFADKAIFVEAGGGETLEAAGAAGGFGSLFVHDFDTTVVSDPTYELAANGFDIALSSGRHLVMYSTRYDDTGTNRAEMQSNLSLNFAPITVGRSQGYIRNTGNGNATVMTGGGIITVAADDDILGLETVRTDINPNVNVDPARTANGTSIQLLKLDDAWDFLSVSLATDQAGTVGITAVDVTYDTLDPDSSLGTAFSFTDPSGAITLNETGLYLVFAHTGIEKANNATRTAFQQFLTLDGLEVGGSKTTTYVRGNANSEQANRGVTSFGTILSATSGQVLNVEMIMEAGGSAGTIKGGQTALTIVKLPPTTKTIQLFDDSNQEVNDLAVDPVVFGTQVVPPGSDFSHTPGDSLITVNTDDCYLFLGSVFTSSDATNDNQDRIIPLQGWQIDGTGGFLNYGQGAQYNRDNGNNRTSGSWAGGLLDLTNGQTVQMITQEIGNNDQGADSVVALQGLSISSLVVTNDPAISVNNVLSVLPNATATITNAFLETFDNDTPPTGLTYTVTSVPAGGTLQHTVNGAIGNGGMFTQDDIDNNRVEFDAGPVAVVGGFDFTVSDGTASDSGSFVIDVAFPATEVTITSGSDVTEGDLLTFTVNASVAPVGANLTVNLTYGGSATDGSDFTGVAAVDILDGTTNAVINLSTAIDGLFEGSEAVTAIIDSASGATVTASVGTPGSVTALILDGSNSAPTATNIVQVSAGTGNVDLADIVVTDADADYDSNVTGAAGDPLFQTNGIANFTVFSDGRANATSAFDIDGTGPALNAGAGMSVEIKFTPAPGDLTGVVDVWEIGGSSNGSAIFLVDGVPHFLSKAGGSPANAPTDDGTVPGAFNDLDWMTDNTIVVPLDGATVLTAGVPACLALVFDISGGFLWSSVNGSPETTNVLLNQDNTNWRGDHSVRTGTNAGGGTGGSNNTTGLFGTTAPAVIKNLANGSSSVSSVRFWNESGGMATGTAGSLDQITATLTIDGWVPGAGDLTATSGNGESYLLGQWTITGDAPTVNAALAAVQFVTGVLTADPTFINVSIDDGDEDGGGPLTGTVVVTAVAPDPIYVDDDFAGNIGDPIADGDLGDPGDQAATLGVSAYATLTEALGAVSPTGTIIVNDGDYSTENITLADSVTLSITDTAGPVQVGDLAAGLTNSIVLQGSNTLEIGATNINGAGINSAISGTGNLTKVGTGLLVVRQVNTYTGTTTVLDGLFRVGQNNALALQSELAGDGPVIVTDPGRLELNVDVDKTISQTGAISGTGSVGTLGDGTVIFDGAGPNTFTGGFELGDGTTSNFDGVDTGNKQGFVVVNHNDHLGTGLVLSRGSQLQAGTPGLVIPNDIDVTGGGFRCGGTVDYELSGAINPIDSGTRGYGNYGLEGTDLTISGTIFLDSQVNFEGVNNKDNGSWTVTGDISGPSNLLTQATFDDGLVVLAGNNTYAGTTSFATGLTLLNGTHTGGGTYTVQGNGTFGGTGSTDSAVIVNGIIGAGTSPGILTTGNLTVGGTISVEINDVTTPGVDFDQIVVIGTVDVSGADIAISGSGTNLGTITIIDNDLADGVIGVPTVSGATSGNVTGTADTVGGDGNDVDLVLAVVGPVDTDGDDIPDAYELANGLNPNDPADRLSDLDGDGFSAIFEYAMGTLAGDATSSPIFEINHVSATQVEITYGPITAGVTYKVNASADGQAFSEIDSFTAVADGATNLVIDATGGLDVELYQISVDLPLP